MNSAVRKRNFPFAPGFDWVVWRKLVEVKKKILIALAVIALFVGVVSVMISHQRETAREALAAYKAELRAKGEVLTYEEAAYSLQLETNSNLERFVSLADQLEAISTLPGQLDYTGLLVTGRLNLMWLAERPAVLGSASSADGGINWEPLAADCRRAAPTLSELRAELEHPPRVFGWNFTNPLATQPRNPFVQKRKVAQFFAADAMVALRDRNLHEVQSDLRALTQLAQVHRADPALVSAMIRVAISGLALEVTRQALPSDGWDDGDLEELQRQWGSIDLSRTLEAGIAGDRMLGVQVFQMAREGDSQARRMGQSGIRGGLVSTLYRSVMDADELFYLQQQQRWLEATRALGTVGDAHTVREDVRAGQAAINEQLNSPLGRYKHLVSLIALPNFAKAFEFTAQRESERRMTITAIALRRFHLAHGRYPAALYELVPQFLAVELIDPWSGKPFRYRLNADGTFTLYSVGEDGRDDGGDPTPSKPTNDPPDLWTGKDALWPTPVFPDSPANN